MSSTEDVHNGCKMKVYRHEDTVYYDGNIVMEKYNSFSPYGFAHGKVTYVVKRFHFYDEGGRKYTLNQGWFESKDGYRYHGVSFTSKQEKLKRLKIDDKFSYSNSFKDKLIFFVSVGKEYSDRTSYSGKSKTRAEVYIPADYLTELEFTVIDGTSVTGFNMNACTDNE